MARVDELKKELRAFKDEEKSKSLPVFFQIGKAGYPSTDKFLGATVPQCRKIALKFKDLSFPEIEQIIASNYHEERLVALLILTEQFAKGDESVKKQVYDFYLKHLRGVDNWDLVDTSAYNIVGSYLLDKPRDLLYTFVYSKNVWERRIAIVATMAFIRKGELLDTFKIAELLLTDQHDLIQKAVGWLLREAGKKDKEALVEFLKRHYRQIPRTTLRYAIEKFPEEVRKEYLKGNF